MTHQRSRGGSAALWGIIIGVILAALVVLHQLLLVGIVRRGFALRGSLVYTALALLVAAALYFLAGFLAARRANAIEAGLFAGLIAGIIVGVTALALTLIVLALRPPLAVRHPGLLRAQEVAGIVREVLGTAVQALIGAGLGALGGLAGRRRTPPIATEPYTPSSPPTPPTLHSEAPRSAVPQPPYPYAYQPDTPPMGGVSP
ncbi:MAG TPA: hypothetical protein VJQ45_09005 [Ktedonobacterales bacterium]|nr:hypothetical protein [Ktedonobacterales bacterium]